ncbi:MAG TPA: Ig-like domain-containing protein, partial [Candidatus Saccharimonadales bacterium]|nr:Ig-like domain-containing protein [Candidatus Saccharimonadales bacterium]
MPLTLFVQCRRSRRPPAGRHLFALSLVLVLATLVLAPALRASAGTQPSTNWHFAVNSNFSGSTFVPGQYGFNIADVASVSEVNGLPSGVKGLVWLGLCNGADSNFVNTVQPFVGNAKVFGYYMMDEPDASGQYKAKCTPANMKAETDWIHAHDPGKKTFIIMLNMAGSSNPTYANTYNPSNSGLDLYGLDPYPCRQELSGCDYSYIPKAVAAAKSYGIPQSAIVPVYQTFGGGNWVDDGGGKYKMPSAAELTQILDTWGASVPNPVFDYAYSWGSQNGDTALADVSTLQQVMKTHNTAATSPPADSRPTITLLKPTDGLTVSAGSSVNITGTASDDNGIAKVEAKVDGTVVKSFAAGTSSFTTAWIATSGTHTVTATATDTSGQTTTATATITVSAPGGQPCTPPATDYGTVTLTAGVAANGTYRVWSRMAAPSSTATYLLEIDGTSCFTVGGSGVPVYAADATQHFVSNASNWIAKTKAGSFVDITLASGSHTIKMIGTADGVAVDRLVLTQDTSCTPTGVGDNCANPKDNTSPAVNITAPADGTTLTGTTTVKAQATDDTAVTKVEFYVDGQLRGTDTTGNSSNIYTYSLDPSTLTNGNHVLAAKAYDAALNSATSSPVTITVGTTPPPTTTPGDINGDGKVDFLDFSALA